jgi:hypothetical protein
VVRKIARNKHCSNCIRSALLCSQKIRTSAGSAPRDHRLLLASHPSFYCWKYSIPLTIKRRRSCGEFVQQRVPISDEPRTFLPSCFKFPIDEGGGSRRKFPSMHTFFKLVHKPSSEGMPPPNSLWSSRSLSGLVQFEI